MAPRPTKRALVLAHGALHGPWCWHDLITRIEARGIRCVAVDLNRGELEADRIALQAEVDRLIGEGYRVCAMGHSLGCASVAQLDPATIDAVLLLAGPVAGPGTPDAADCVTPAFTTGLERQPDGRRKVDSAHARNTFYHRCTSEQAEAAVARLRPTFVYAASESATPIWKATDATYIQCTDDRVVEPAYQSKVAAIFPFSASLDSDHSPMIGQPDALASIVLVAMDRVS